MRQPALVVAREIYQAGQTDVQTSSFTLFLFRMVPTLLLPLVIVRSETEHKPIELFQKLNC